MRVEAGGVTSLICTTRSWVPATGWLRIRPENITRLQSSSRLRPAINSTRQSAGLAERAGSGLGGSRPLSWITQRRSPGAGAG